MKCKPISLRFAEHTRSFQQAASVILIHLFPQSFIAEIVAYPFLACSPHGFTQSRIADQLIQFPHDICMAVGIDQIAGLPVHQGIARASDVRSNDRHSRQRRFRRHIAEPFTLCQE